MDNDLIAAMLVRTDAAVGLLMSVMVTKGVISAAELEALLDRAALTSERAGSGAVVATVFESLKSFLRTDLGDGPFDSDDSGRSRHPVEHHVQ